MVNQADLPTVRGQYRFNCPLGTMTWFQVGGPAQVLFRPEDAQDLANFMTNKPRELAVVTIGVGSNIIIKDTGYPGAVVKLGRNFNYIKQIDECTFKIGCATLDVHVANFAASAEVAGLEFLSGIPGTIGGAIAMNAGAYGACTADILVCAQGIDQNGNIIDIPAENMNMSYRHNPHAAEVIFTEITVRGKKEKHENIAAAMQEIQEKRNNSQPVRSKTGGSTFRNPLGHSAWRLIDDAGCRGMKIGGAMVSELHTNFIINNTNATAADLIMLIAEVKSRVYKKSGIMLEEEIKLIG